MLRFRHNQETSSNSVSNFCFCILHVKIVNIPTIPTQLHKLKQRSPFLCIPGRLHRLRNITITFADFNVALHNVQVGWSNKGCTNSSHTAETWTIIGQSILQAIRGILINATIRSTVSRMTRSHFSRDAGRTSVSDLSLNMFLVLFIGFSRDKNKFRRGGDSDHTFSRIVIPILGMRWQIKRSYSR